MRKLVLLAAAVPLLLLAPSAVADAGRSGGESRCAVPDAHSRYDLDRFTVRVSLPVSGCGSREDRRFELSAQVVRMDNHGGRDVTERTILCGPFRPAGESDPQNAATGSSCHLKLTVDHPDVENAQYDVEITYSGAAAERTMTAVLFCTSDGDDAVCDR